MENPTLTKRWRVPSVGTVKNIYMYIHTYKYIHTCMYIIHIHTAYMC